MPDNSDRYFLHHDDLGAEIDQRADVERIAGEDDEVELRCRAEQPVELRQRIVQIGHDEAAHLEDNPVLKKQARRKTLRNSVTTEQGLCRA